MICTECNTERGELTHLAHEGPVCWPCYVAINAAAPKYTGPVPETAPGWHHALGCQFNSIPVIACVCGLPNALERR